jgi:UDP-galactopyranose mutase
MSRLKRILIVGAGFAGAVAARQLAETADLPVLLIDSRDHLAGNCHTSRDPGTDVLVHRYGAHIFHTDREDVWKYVQRFGEFRPFFHRVKASIARGVFGLPITLATINQFYGKRLSPDEARAFVATLGDQSIGEPRNFEEQALKFLGRELYEAFFHGYSKKQWGCEPRELSASILKRLPVRFNYNEGYYTDPFQGMPLEGYTALFERMTKHKNIKILLSTPWTPEMQSGFSHVVFTGPLDQYYGYRFGRLGYRTVFWENQTLRGDFQGTAVMNYPEIGKSYTRIVEHKHFAPWEEHPSTFVSTEYSKETEPIDVPFYPKRLATDKTILSMYVELAQQEAKVSFLGRLGTYRYLDMHQVIAESLEFAPLLAAAMRSGKPRPIWPEAVRDKTGAAL